MQLFHTPPLRSLCQILCLAALPASGCPVLHALRTLTIQCCLCLCTHVHAANAQLVFEDHCKDCYLGDLLKMEEYGLVTAVSALVEKR